MLSAFPALIIEDVERIHKLFIYFGIAAAGIFGTVIFCTIYFARKYRERPGDDVPEQSHGNRKFEIGMTLLSFAITVVFFILTINTMNAVQKVPDNPQPDIIITGHQWWWEAEYTKSGVITANEVHVPAGKHVLLQLNSDDVVHSWFVPKLGRKMDLIPGRNNYLSIYADKPGVYTGGCNEFCGAEHAWMRIRVIAQTKDDFDSWTVKQLQPAVSEGNALFQRGKRIFEKRTCTNCHAIRGSGAKGGIGPDLTHFASRDYFLSNIKRNTKANVRNWLAHPKEIKPGANMPNFILDKEELSALETYLSNLK